MTDDVRTRRLRELAEKWRMRADALYALMRKSEHPEADAWAMCANDVAAVLDTEGNQQADVSCEACDAGYRLVADGIHYDDARGGQTWGVCRKVVEQLRQPPMKPVCPLGYNCFPPRVDTEGDRPFEKLAASQVDLPVEVAKLLNDNLRTLYDRAATEGDRPAQLPCGCYIAQCPTHRGQAAPAHIRIALERRGADRLPDPPVQP
jgi:hypothetical protein